MAEIILLILTLPSGNTGKYLPEWQEKPGYKSFSPQDTGYNVQLVGWID